MGWFFFVVAALLVALGAAYWYWRRQIDAEIAEGAAIEWAHFQKHEPDFLGGMSEEDFRQIYARVNVPRFPGYALAMFASFLLSLPVTFALLALLMFGAEQVGLVPAPIDFADRLLMDNGQLIFFKETPPEAALYYIKDLAGFYYFFGVLVAWLGIVAFFMRRYHGRRPGYLRDEIIRSRELP